MNGERVGTWTLPSRGPMELRYDADWIASAAGRPLSLSLLYPADVSQPLRSAAVPHFFDNLLPDHAAIRRRIATRFRTGHVDAFSLLAAIGRDCVGAVQLLGEDESPAGPAGSVAGTPLSDEDIERHLLAVTSNVAFGALRDDEDFRISLAGAQEKHAFLRDGEAWLRPDGATPTTHIFKLPLGLIGAGKVDFTTSVDNEWLCLRLLRAYGLRTARAEIATFGAQRVLVVERFDRLRDGEGRLWRLPQEDFCQVYGVPSERKYESHGGPGLRELFRVLANSEEAERDRRELLASQILFWMLRAPDGHAKNFSIFLRPGGTFRLTPMYDVMTALPAMGAGPNRFDAHKLTMAMALIGKNRHYDISRIQRRHFSSTALAVGYADTAEPLVSELIARTPAVIDEVSGDLPAGFSEAVAAAVFEGLQAAADALEAMGRA
jgi:serine/threonine-protein kinase HipA